MGKAEIIEDLGSGYYKIKRIYAGRSEMQAKIALLNSKKATLQAEYDSMPESTPDEIWAKRIVKLQIDSITKKIAYLNKYFPDDPIVNAYCADLTEDLTGEVGTIDVPGELTEHVNIAPGYQGIAAYDGNRDGEFWPSIAMGPWSTLLNRAILPGWQKFKPTYRYGWIVPGSINHEDNTCHVSIQPAFSSQKGLDVNQDDGFGVEIVEEEREINSFYQPSVAAYPGFQAFCVRNPDNPICTNTEIGTPVELTTEQYEQIRDINFYVNTAFRYESDQSGYHVGDYFDIMRDPATDTGDCEDFALTKMDMIIQAGILEAKNIQLIFCKALGVDGSGHAVAGIQTINKGFLILDNRFDSPMERTRLSGIYAWEEFQLAGTTIVKTQRIKGSVPIEYMSCAADTFSDGDEVIIEFEGQDWSQPKVIGFKEKPEGCGVWSMFGGEPLDITAYHYEEGLDTWTVRADELQHFSGLYFFEIPEDWASEHGWPLGLVWPIHIRHAPIITKSGGNIFSFGGWFDNGDYFEDKYTSSYAMDTCERFTINTGVWSRRNKDQYVGRSCGAGWAINGRSYIACGAFYDDRLDTYYPHIELEPNYVWGDYEHCNSPYPYNVPPTPYWNAHYDPEWDPELLNYDKLYKGFGSATYDFGEYEIIWDCTAGHMPVGAHSYPPGAGVPYDVRYNDLGGVAYYCWLDANPAWSKRWYNNQLFGECLCFDDVSNSYTQKQATTETMMMGSFQLSNVGYMVGGTHAEISDIIRSADMSGITDDAKKYDPETNTWAALNNFPEERLNPSCFAANGKGYAFSGWSETNHPGSTEQLFGHEEINMTYHRIHPMSSWYGGKGAFQQRPGGTAPSLGIFPAETASLFCTNTMHEYDGTLNTWVGKNDAATPIGNCRYREFYNHFGTIERPFYYRLDENNCLVQEYFHYSGPEDPLFYQELSNPGPYGDQPYHKQQHIYKYPAIDAGGGGYITSLEYMARYNPVTDSYTVKDEGIKDHSDGGFA